MTSGMARPLLQCVFAATETITSKGQVTKSANWSATIGRSPIHAAPMAAPTKPSSEIGVSRTRSLPNLSSSPAVAPNAPAEGADLLAHQEHALVLPQRVGERAPDRLEGGDLPLSALRHAGGLQLPARHRAESLTARSRGF
jgi:hypothetical protein